MYGWEKGWDWLKKLAANTGIFTARSRDVPNVVSKGEFAVGFAVPSYMAFAEVLGGYRCQVCLPQECLCDSRADGCPERGAPSQGGPCLHRVPADRGRTEDIYGTWTCIPLHPSIRSRAPRVPMQRRRSNLQTGSGPSTTSRLAMSTMRRSPGRKRGSRT